MAAASPLLPSRSSGSRRARQISLNGQYRGQVRRSRPRSNDPRRAALSGYVTSRSGRRRAHPVAQRDQRRTAHGCRPRARSLRRKLALPVPGSPARRHPVLAGQRRPRQRPAPRPHRRHAGLGEPVRAVQLAVRRAAGAAQGRQPLRGAAGAAAQPRPLTYECTKSRPSTHVRPLATFHLKPRRVVRRPGEVASRGGWRPSLSSCVRIRFEQDSRRSST